MSVLLVTGSNGLIGSEVVSYFAEKGWDVFGVDNNMRAEFFGSDGDTRWNQERLESKYPKRFKHIEADIRNREKINIVLQKVMPDLVVHAAAQPSHDLAAKRPFDDFDVNAVGTLNVIEATRKHTVNAIFCHMSTNKVYGDAPNELPLQEQETRWDFLEKCHYDGISEDMRIDRCKHSLFGVSKVASDVLVQEYGRYFGMQTCCLRGGCLTGPMHSGVELHGFLSYLVRANIEKRKYKIFGYKGKQVRDNIHAYDVARFIEEFYKAPRCGEVYNIGGGRDNSISIIEAFRFVEKLTSTEMRYEYLDKAREGDHICYISDLSKARKHFPDWDITIGIDKIITEIVEVRFTE